MRRARSGFTLVELLVTITLIGLIVSSATLSFATMLRAGRLNQGTEILIGALREAQMRAFEDGSLWRVIVDTGDTLLLQRAKNPLTPNLACGLTGWENTTVREYPLPKGVTVGLSSAGLGSNDCINFGQAGRAVGAGPHVVLPPPRNMPEEPQTLSRLLDGQRLSEDELQLFSPFNGKSGAVTWYITEMPALEIDLGELRYTPRFCVGLLSVQDWGVRYPDQVSVLASAQNPAAWEISLGTVRLPADPTDGSRARECVNFNVGRQIRHLQISLSGARSGSVDWSFDEIDFGPRFFTVQYGTDSKIVEVNPTTGRVTSRKGS